MNNTNEKVCRLCLKLICSNDFDAIEDATMQMFNSLLLRLDLDKNKENLICNNCADNLQKSFDFKSTCISLNNNELLSTRDSFKLNLTEACTVFDNRKKCRFCVKSTEEGGFTCLNETKDNILIVDMLVQHVPELKLNISEELISCEDCLKSLQHLLSFITACLHVEEKVKNDNIIETTDDKSIIKLDSVKPLTQVNYNDNDVLYVLKVEEVCVKSEEDFTITAENQDENMETDDLDTIIKDYKIAGSMQSDNKRRATLADFLTAVDDNEGAANRKQIDIAIMPPVNACDEWTDEDTGDEDDISLKNLAASQLQAEAEPFEQNDDEDWEAKYSISRPKTSGLWRDNSVETKSETYEWEKQDIENFRLEVDWPNFCLPSSKLSPLELFENFMDKEVIDMFVNYTNSYAASKNRQSNVTVEEMRVFFGILLLSGYVSVPRRAMFWDNSPDVHNSVVSDSMPRNRFEHILSNIHCCDNNNLDRNDTFAKVRPFFDKMNSRFLQFAPNEEFHCVDEVMVPYLGPHTPKQFTRGKSLRCGYKLWTGATASGYIVWYDPYQGAKSEICYETLGLGPSVVLQYTEVLFSKCKLPYSIYFNKFFTTLPLISALTQRGIKCTGAIRENRLGNCPLVSDVDSKNPMDFRVADKKSLIVVKWFDNELVYVASNYYSVFPIQEITICSKKAKRKREVPVRQPLIIRNYNANIAGAHRSEQNIGSYPVSVRGRKWYVPLITHLVDAAEQNAWQLHRQQGGYLDRLSFRRNVALSLMQSNEETKSYTLGTAFERTLEDGSRYDGLDHLIKRQSVPTKCSVCRKRVSTKCCKCNVALHVRCFMSYHVRN